MSAVSVEDQTWASRAACANTEPDALFVQGAAQRSVRTRCFGCEVRMECLADALDSETTFGVWGGLTERERRALLRRYPEVTDWSAWLREGRAPIVDELRAPHAPRILAMVREA